MGIVYCTGSNSYHGLHLGCCIFVHDAGEARGVLAGGTHVLRGGELHMLRSFLPSFLLIG